tara:strand:- start:309 stop:563 length:255 start_codon:yes stop_codon:yes gene_type:complete
VIQSYRCLSLQAGGDKGVYVFGTIADKPPGFDVRQVIAFRCPPDGEGTNRYTQDSRDFLLGEKLFRHSFIPHLTKDIEQDAQCF